MNKRSHHGPNENQNRTTRRTIKRDYLIKMLGGKCGSCELEYDGTNSVVFDFHHKSPAEKVFCLNRKNMDNRSLKKCIEEAEKCRLYCANCHRVLHYQIENIYNPNL